MTRSIFVVAVLALTACPVPVDKPDAGTDDGGPNPNPIDACSGGCAINQKCDVMSRTCRDGCDGSCDGGTFCQKTNNTFACQAIVTSCAGMQCSAGEVACLGGACACLGPARGTLDSCFGNPFQPGDGFACDDTAKCVTPKKHQQCKADSAPCPTGLVCNPVFGDVNDNNVCDLGDTCVCTQPCSAMAPCNRGEICSSVGCLASGLFNGQECAIQVDAGVTNDAGMPVLSLQTVGVGSTCLRKDNMGNLTETSPTGTCTYAFFHFADQQPFPFATCQPPGGATENSECVVGDNSITGQAVQCSTGLECAGMRGGTKGVCLRTCNALPPSVTYPMPYPGCGMNESCVNLYRREDIGRDGALLGVCAKKCNVFQAGASTCGMIGTIPAVCVPTNPDGRVVVSSDGSGICLPQRETIAQLDMPCNQSDPFKGASCGPGQICPPAGFSTAAVCTQLCDVTCSSANPPARCATQVNTTCPTGKTCRAVTTTTGARVGFCQ